MPSATTFLDKPQPEELFTDEALHAVDNGAIPNATLDIEDDAPAHDDHPHVCIWDYQPTSECHCGWLLRITTPSRTLVYRIGDYHPEYNAWHGRWPD